MRKWLLRSGLSLEAYSLLRSVMIDFLLFGLGIGLAVAAAEVRKHERKRKKLGGE